MRNLSERCWSGLRAVLPLAGAILGTFIFWLAASFFLNLIGFRMLFYRGLLALFFAVPLAIVISLILRKWTGLMMPVSTLFSCVVLSASALVAFLIVFPVTYERSVSVFMLSQIARLENDGVTAVQLETLLRDTYISADKAVALRLHEQLESGTISLDEQGSVRLTRRGWNLLCFGELLQPVFGYHNRYLDGICETKPSK